MRFSTFIILLLAVVLAIFGYNYLTADKEAVKTNIPTKPVFGTNDPKIIKLKKEIDSTMKSLLSAINGITDATSAQQAVPTLTKISQDLNGYLDRMKPIPDDDKLQIKNYMMDFVKYLKQPLKKVSKIPQAPQIIDPAIEKIDTVLMFYKPM